MSKQYRRKAINLPTNASTLQHSEKHETQRVNFQVRGRPPQESGHVHARAHGVCIRRFRDARIPNLLKCCCGLHEESMECTQRSKRWPWRSGLMQTTLDYSRNFVNPKMANSNNHSCLEMEPAALRKEQVLCRRRAQAEATGPPTRFPSDLISQEQATR